MNVIPFVYSVSQSNLYITLSIIGFIIYFSASFIEVILQMDLVHNLTCKNSCKFCSHHCFVSWVGPPVLLQNTSFNTSCGNLQSFLVGLEYFIDIRLILCFYEVTLVFHCQVIIRHDLWIYHFLVFVWIEFQQPFPFQNSRLTHILEDCFTGTRTIMWYTVKLLILDAP